MEKVDGRANSVMRPLDEWIPEVAEVASRCYAEAALGTRYANRIHRLGTDKRLASVWKTLARDNDKLARLFDAATWDASPMYTRKELAAMSNRLRAMAKELRHLGVGLHPQDQRKQFLRGASKVCDEFASNVDNSCASPMVIARKRDPEVRAYVVALSREVCALLGQPFDKLIGTIAMVALDLKEPVPRRTVEYWRKHRGS